MQIFFAQDWPLRIWLTVGSVAAFVASVRACDVSMTTFSAWQPALWVLVVAVVSPMLGYFAAILLGVFIFGPMYYSRGRINGAPFKERDVVQVLTGPHRGKITTVYAMWQGDSVRVRLGEMESKTFKDVFQTTQLLREPQAEQPPA